MPSRRHRNLLFTPLISEVVSFLTRARARVYLQKSPMPIRALMSRKYSCLLALVWQIPFALQSKAVTQLQGFVVLFCAYWEGLPSLKLLQYPCVGWAGNFYTYHLQNLAIELLTTLQCIVFESFEDYAAQSRNLVPKWLNIPLYLPSCDGMKWVNIADKGQSLLICR